MDGKRGVSYVLAVTLVVSRFQFVWPIVSCKLRRPSAKGLDATWRFFGAMARCASCRPKQHGRDDRACGPALTDDRRDAVPGLHYRVTRGIFVDPARVRAPKDKGRASENQISFVRRELVRRGSLHVAQQDAQRKRRALVALTSPARASTASTRTGAARGVRARGERGDAPTRRAAPFDVPTWTEAKVHPDHHVQVARALYLEYRRASSAGPCACAPTGASVRIYLGPDGTR